MEEAARKGVGPRSQASNKAPNSHAAAVITAMVSCGDLAQRGRK